MDKYQAYPAKPHKWDTFFGNDPLEGRINDLTVAPYFNLKQGYVAPISNQNMINTYQEARSLLAKWSAPAKLTKKLSLDESIFERKSTFASVVASNSTGKPLRYCTFCELNREGYAYYTSHTTNNCLILEKYVCPICRKKGHTISHCKLNATGSSIVTTMRRTDEMSSLYDEHFPSTFSHK